MTPVETYSAILQAYLDCKPAPAYLEIHPRLLYEILGSICTLEIPEQGKLAGVEVRTHNKLTGWRVVARPYGFGDVPEEMSDGTKPYEPRKPLHIQSPDFDDTERNEYERKRQEYLDRRAAHRGYR